MKRFFTTIIRQKVFDIERLKMEQGKDPIIQQKIAEIMKNPIKCSYEFKDGLLYKLLIDAC